MTTTAATPKARRQSPENEPLLAGLGRYDYADSFEIRLDAPDAHTAEEWARCSLEEAPAPTRITVENAWRHALRFQLEDPSEDGNVLGMPIVESTPDLIRLEAQSPLLRAMIIGRCEPTRVAITTILFYKQPVAMRPIWAAVGPAHRRIASHLLEHTAARFAR